MDQNKQVVKKIAATGAAFPISVPTGSFFDYNSDKPYNDQNKEITIRFRCNGAEYMDDILIKEFNKSVIIFNPSMSDKWRSKDMVLASANTIAMFNNRGYPRINPDTNVLEWWVDNGNFANRTNSLIEQTLSTTEVVNNPEFQGD
jgi:hypothetical protein